MNKNETLLVMIPTYNEADNVEWVVSGIRALGLNADILFIDDNSPDGTGEVLDRLAVEHDRVKVIHRSGKLGIGSAHIDGIRWAYEHDYDLLLTMDSDHTHLPSDIPRFLERAARADVVVGSRFRRRDSLMGWAWSRKLITHLGHFLTNWLLEFSFDATGAFRLYRLSRIPRGIFEMIETFNYSFFYESLFLLHKNNIRIAEVSISLPARTYGHSKMRLRDAWEGLMFLFRLGLKWRAFPARMRWVEPFRPEGSAGIDDFQEQWDSYWSGKGHRGKWVYDLIAAFYRHFIIRPALNHFLRRFCRPGASVLHAGCGSGAVDVDAEKHLRITAMDISTVALTEYARHHTDKPTLMYGSVFDIPATDESFEGIFNLGVMEHFPSEDIPPVLREFNRVLKPGANVILFWPPSYGLTVRVLKVVHFILKKVARSDIQLHPPEQTYITSRRQTARWFRDAGFRLRVFYFGLRDFFTHQVIVAEKIKSRAGKTRHNVGQPQKHRAGQT